MIPPDKLAWQQKYLEHFVQHTPGKPVTEQGYWSLVKLAKDFDFNLEEQPFIIKLFLENVMRHFTTHSTVVDVINNLTQKEVLTGFEFSYYPSRVLMQDYTGVPALVDLAAMRDAIVKEGGDANNINPICPVDLVIDHSVIADKAGSNEALQYNRQCEMERNQERYQFLKWAQSSFDNLRIVPPGRGICHQVNLEYLAQVVREEEGVLIPDTLIGTDSHTTMINGLGVLGWGAGGIEAEAVMLGQPLSLSMPIVVGVLIEGELPVGTTATDLVLTITQTLRQYGVVGKYVEFYGTGALSLSVADRATLANMAPEYGATCGLFPIDEKVIDYLALTNRPPKLTTRVKRYAQAQQLWADETTCSPIYSENITIDLNKIVPCVAGPKRPQDRLALSAIKQTTLDTIELNEVAKHAKHKLNTPQAFVSGDIAIAAITSCTNTSNPRVMLQAGLLAKAALERGLAVNHNVKTSLAPGSQVVARYLDDTGLQVFLDQLGFNRIGFGCTTCIGNSGPLNEDIESHIAANKLSASAVLSGNRNFEGRIHPAVKLNWLMSPPLVVAFALVGHTRINFDSEPIGVDKNGIAVYLRDIWPSDKVVTEAMSSITQESYALSYTNMFVGDEAWEALAVSKTVCYLWDETSTYIAKPPFLDLLAQKNGSRNEVSLNKTNSTLTSFNIKSAHILAVLGDSITTDHISPAGKISLDSPAGKYLSAKGITPAKFNSYGARRGHHEVMVRGTFANNRLQNKMVRPQEGGFTRVFGQVDGNDIQPLISNDISQIPSTISIFDASEIYGKTNTALVVFAGKEYGTGSSRDWAAKGCQLLGIKAVIAESFERIHRSNLVGMGIMPLQLPPTMPMENLRLRGDETIDVLVEPSFNDEHQSANQVLKLVIHRSSNSTNKKHTVLPVTLCINSSLEQRHFFAGGLLPYVWSQFL
tara:strand:+ start:7688 stop:10477 length:2790 start_codon:yes stop_codon:yes gene_type:complete